MMERSIMIAAKFVHTNLIADNWRSLASFYIEVFGCKPVPPERDLKGQWLDRATGVYGAHIRGTHLRLPGHGDKGPTLEIFQYSPQLERVASGPNQPGFGHLAFCVDNVAEAYEVVLSKGGSAVGEVVSREIEGAGRITFAYVADPEGNIIELQQWDVR
jgi:predicted enzyme related to lactoylglutathione lyase